MGCRGCRAPGRGIAKVSVTYRCRIGGHGVTVLEPLIRVRVRVRAQVQVRVRVRVTVTVLEQFCSLSSPPSLTLHVTHYERA